MKPTMKKLILSLLFLLACSEPTTTLLEVTPMLDVSQTVDEYVVMGAPSPGQSRRVFPLLGASVVSLNQGQVTALRSQGATVSKVGILQLHTIPWHLDRIDQRLGYDDSYNASRTGQGVTAYVMDTGIYNHPDFGGRVEFGVDITGGNGEDCYGHGTSVAGVLGSNTYGVAPDVSIVNVRFFDCSGYATDVEALAAMEWMLANLRLPAVINMSWGGTPDEDITALELAVQRLIDAGATVVVSAGNTGGDSCYLTPARVATAITVGATTQTDARASFSSYGICVDMFAPGQGVQAPNNRSGTSGVSGTSFSSPITAGVAALILEESPNASPADVTAILLSRTTKEVVIDARSPDWDLVYTGTDTMADPGAAENTPPEAWFGYGCPGIGGNCLVDQSTDDRGIVRREWYIGREFAGTDAILLNALPECDGRTQVELRVWDTEGENDFVKRNLRHTSDTKCRGNK